MIICHLIPCICYYIRRHFLTAMLDKFLKLKPKANTNNSMEAENPSAAGRVPWVEK